MLNTQEPLNKEWLLEEILPPSALALVTLSLTLAPSPPLWLRHEDQGQAASQEGHHLSLELPTFSCNPNTCFRMIFYKIKWGLGIYSQIYLLLVCQIQVISSLGVLLSVKLRRSPPMVQSGLLWPTELAHIPAVLCCSLPLVPFLSLCKSSGKGSGYGVYSSRAYLALPLLVIILN